MPKFTIFWIATYCLGLLAAFVNPVFGTYTYLFEYYLRPGIRWWGVDLPPFGYSAIASAVLITAYLTRRSALPESGPIYNPTMKYLVGLGVIMLLVTPSTAVNMVASWDKAVAYFTLITFYFLIIGTVRSEKAFDGFILLHMLGSFYWGWEQYINPRRASARAQRVGSGDTLNDNFAAAHLLTVLPFIAVYLLMAKDKRHRAVALVCLPFVVNVFVLCNSRGGTLGLIAATLCAILIARTGHRARMVGVAVGAALTLFLLADPEYVSRQMQMRDAVESEDSNWGGRRSIWSDGIRMVADYPLGAGGFGFALLSPIYTPNSLEESTGLRAPHNTLLLVAAEWGVFGLIAFVGYYISMFRLLNRVRARAAMGDFWYYRAVALQLSIVGLFVAGLFTDRLYAEAPYWIGGLAVALHRIQSYELAKTKSVERAQPVPSANPAGPFERWAPGRQLEPSANAR